MRLPTWSAVKAMLFQPFGGQETASPAGIDWWLWSGAPPGSGFDYRALAGNLWENPVIAAGVAWIQRAFPEAPLQVLRREGKTGEENPVPEHDLLRLMRRPNPWNTEDELWQSIISDWVLTGNAYLVKQRNAGGRPIELYHVPAGRIKPQWDTSGREFIGFYRYRAGSQQVDYPVEDVVHFRYGKHPMNERLGWSPLLAGLREIAALNEGANYRGALLRNMGVPSHLIAAKDPLSPMTGDQTKEFHAAWAARVSGEQRGRPLISNLPVTAEKIGYSPAELDLGKMLNWDADTVLSLLGLSSMLVGVSAGAEQKTYANYAEAREAGWEQCVIPMQKSLDETLTHQLLPDFGDADTERVAHDLADVRILQEDQTALWKRLTEAVKEGWITINEARSEVGLPSIEGQDELREPAAASPFEPESSGDAAAAEQPAGRNGNGREPVGAR